MKTITRILKSKKGETLVESMVSILIFTFASIIMLSMVSSAADINEAAKEVDRQYHTDMLKIEMANAVSTASFEPTVSFSILPKNQVSSFGNPVAVKTYGSADLYAYYIDTSEGGSG